MLYVCYAIERYINTKQYKPKFKIMTDIVLKKDIVDKVKSNPLLFGQVASALGMAPLSLPRLLNSRDKKLTQASVLSVIRKELNIKKDSELLEAAEV